MKEYNTVLKEACSELIEKKSRFICSVKPVVNESDALNFISKVSNKYKDASHNVFAYIIAGNVEIQRASDDGEPQGTAGIPVLEVIKREELTNICVIVTRYFGGILLGASGLVRAYSSGARQGIIAAQKCRMCAYYNASLTVGYPLLGKIQNSMLSLGNVITNIEYTDSVNIVIKIKYNKIDNTNKIIQELTCGETKLDYLGSYYDICEEF